MSPSVGYSAPTRPGTSFSEHVAREMQAFPTPPIIGNSTRRAARMKRFVFATAGGVRRVSIATGRRGAKWGKRFKLINRAIDDSTMEPTKGGISSSDVCNAIDCPNISSPQIGSPSRNGVLSPVQFRNYLKGGPPCSALPFLTPATSIRDILNAYWTYLPSSQQPKRSIPPAPARAVFIRQSRLYTHRRPGSHVRSSSHFRSHVRSSSQATSASNIYVPSFLRPQSRRASTRYASGVTMMSDASSDVLGLTPIYEATGIMPSPLLRRPRIRVFPTADEGERRQTQGHTLETASGVDTTENSHSENHRERRGRRTPIDVQFECSSESNSRLGISPSNGRHSIVSNHAPPARYSNYTVPDVDVSSGNMTHRPQSTLSSTRQRTTSLLTPTEERKHGHRIAAAPVRFADFSCKTHQSAPRRNETDPHYLWREAARHRYTQSFAREETPSTVDISNEDIQNVSEAVQLSFDDSVSGRRNRRQRKRKPDLSIDTTLSQRTYRSSWGLQWHAPLLREGTASLPPMTDQGCIHGDRPAST
jgi:hypothetical protein